MNSTSKIAVGMSGGVDSNVAACLLREQGYEVVGLTLRLWDHATRCVGLEDIERAKAVAAKLDIPHHVIDARADFEEMIVQHFADEYARGRTPSPCIRCNPLIKFGVMLQEALALGCDGISTGHYIRLVRRDGLCHLERGVDRGKDQSYFLHRLKQQVLQKTLFPLGEMVKEDVRAYALEQEVTSATQSESQDLCFVSSGRYVPFVQRYHETLPGRGPIVDDAGRVLGSHDGFYHFTVGQRKGIGIAATEPYYVKEVRAETNEVVVGFKSEVFSTSCTIDDASWICSEPQGAGFEVQVRYRSKPVRAQIEKQDEQRFRFHFSEPQFAVTPGQAAVVYCGDEVVGGGWICA